MARYGRTAITSLLGVAVLVVAALLLTQTGSQGQGQDPVTPGALCSAEGARARTPAGLEVICTTTPEDPRLRWRLEVGGGGQNTTAPGATSTTAAAPAATTTTVSAPTTTTVPAPTTTTTTAAATTTTTTVVSTVQTTTTLAIPTTGGETTGVVALATALVGAGALLVLFGLPHDEYTR